MTVVTRDIGGCIEWTAARRRDASGAAEWLRSVRLDEAGSVEWLGSIRADTAAPLSWLGSVRADMSSSVEWYGVSAPAANGEYSVISRMSGDTLASLRNFLSWRAPPVYIDPVTGAATANFLNGDVLDVSIQRDAIWRMLWHVANLRPYGVHDVQLAMDYGWANQLPTGDFRNTESLSEGNDVDTAAFFLQFVGRAILLGQAAGTGWQLTYNPAVYDLSVNWLSLPQQMAAIQQHDVNNPNRLLFAAVAFQTASILLGNIGYQTCAETLVQSALNQQQPAGYLAEMGSYDGGKTGVMTYDTSYCGVSVHNLAICCSLRADRADWFAALQRMVDWQVTRVDTNPSGLLIARGGGRTDGQEVGPHTGVTKEQNYSEVGLGLGYAGVLLADAAAQQASAAVLDYFSMTQSNRYLVVG